MGVRRGFCVVLVAATAGVGVATTSAEATSWGENGKIAFSSYGSIHTVEPDGSGLSQVMLGPDGERYDWWPAWSPDGSQLVTSSKVLDPPSVGLDRYWSDTELEIVAPSGPSSTRLQTPKQHSSGFAAWSPDGTRIAYATDALGNPSIRSIQPDGRQDRSVLDGSLHTGYSEPAWSPDGTRIAFVGGVDEYGETDLFTMRADGTDIRRALVRPGIDMSPSWSPDGRTIVFAGTLPRHGTDLSWWWPEMNVYSVPSAGGEATQLTTSGTDDDPVWSPRGDKIAFASDRHMPPGQTAPDIYVMDADGSDETRVTTIGCLQCSPDWQPLPTTEPRPPWVFVAPPGSSVPQPQAPESWQPTVPARPRLPMSLPRVPSRRSVRPPARGIGSRPVPIAIERLAVEPRAFRWRDGGRVSVRVRAPKRLKARLLIARSRPAHDTPCLSQAKPCRAAANVVRRLKPGGNVLDIAAVVPGRRLKAGRYRLTVVVGTARASTAFRVRPRR